MTTAVIVGIILEVCHRWFVAVVCEMLKNEGSCIVNKRVNEDYAEPIYSTVKCMVYGIVMYGSLNIYHNFLNLIFFLIRETVCDMAS